jgi:hypothetical protein
MQIKNRQQILVIAAIALIGLFAADKLLLDPLTTAWKARAKRIAELRINLAEGKNLRLREQSIRSRWDYMRRNTLTNDTSAAEQKVFSAIDSWRQDSHVVISGAAPQWKHDADDYMTYQCRLDASGSMATLARFLYDIERDPMALKLDSIEITARDKDGQQLLLGLQISGLVLTPASR